MTLTAPFPYFGGKRRIAPLVWERFGNVNNYIEPFTGSCAVLLARPHRLVPYQMELINDLDGEICNFWRSIKTDPEGVIDGADHICSELDMHARAHRIADTREEIVERLRMDMDFCDPVRAGWWLYGTCLAIGSDFENARHSLPAYGDKGRGIHRHTPDAHLSRETITHHLQGVIDRMRAVRVACGSWERVVTKATLAGGQTSTGNGWLDSARTGVFLDPPYLEGGQQYAAGGTGTSLATDVLEWCVQWGADKRLRIALCGYSEHYDVLADHGWECVAWKANGGYGSTANKRDSDAKGYENSKREVVWFSPHCLSEAQATLF